MGWVLGAAGAVSQLGSGFRNADIAKEDAAREEQLGQYQAEDAVKRGTVEEMRYRRQLAQLIGKQRNEIGARNVEARGSALDLLGDSAAIGEEDIVSIRNDAARTAWGYSVNANEQSRFQRQQAGNYQAQGIGSALTSGAQAYGMWKQGQ